LGRIRACAASHRISADFAWIPGFARVGALAWSVLEAPPEVLPGVAATKTLVLVGSVAALVAALVATSGVAGPRTTELLLGLGAMVALTLTRSPRR
jgi:hypothetical protein